VLDLTEARHRRKHAVVKGGLVDYLDVMKVAKVGQVLFDVVSLTTPTVDDMVDFDVSILTR